MDNDGRASPWGAIAAIGALLTGLAGMGVWLYPNSAEAVEQPSQPSVPQIIDPVPKVNVETPTEPAKIIMPAPEPAPVASTTAHLNGVWAGRLSWRPGRHSWKFNPDHSFDESEGYRGTWVQTGNRVSWYYPAGTEYHGIIEGSYISGTRTHHSGATGTFELWRES